MLQNKYVINHHEKCSQPTFPINLRDIQDKRQNYTDKMHINVCVCVSRYRDIPHTTLENKEKAFLFPYIQSILTYKGDVWKNFM